MKGRFIYPSKLRTSSYKVISAPDNNSERNKGEKRESENWSGALLLWPTPRARCTIQRMQNISHCPSSFLGRVAVIVLLSGLRLGLRTAIAVIARRWLCLRVVRDGFTETSVEIGNGYDAMVDPLFYSVGGADLARVRIVESLVAKEVLGVSRIGRTILVGHLGHGTLSLHVG